MIKVSKLVILQKIDCLLKEVLAKDRTFYFYKT